MKFDEDEARTLLRRAYRLALRSPDPSTQNAGIVLDAFGRPMGRGINTFTPGIEITPDLLERPKKYAYIEHAERMAIFDAFRHGGGPLYTLVCPWAACTDCARDIVLSGVRTLIRHERGDSPSWNQSIFDGDRIMNAAGVEIITVSGPLGGCDPIRYNGELWTP